jgi:hypothetical protein
MGEETIVSRMGAYYGRGRLLHDLIGHEQGGRLGWRWGWEGTRGAVGA